MNVSSTSSNSNTSSLGNTAISGFGGLVSGMDRDALIEQLTSGTQSKITAQKQDVQKAEWKQTAYQAITDKVLDLEDNYLMYSSGSSLKNTDLFSRNILTAQGDEKQTALISASGASAMSDYIAIKGVQQTASSATMISAAKGSTAEIKTKSLFSDSLAASISVSKLSGTKLEFGTANGVESQGTYKFNTLATFTFPKTYKDSEGKEVTIDYTTENKEELVNQLNIAARQANLDLGNNVKTTGEDFNLFSYHSDENGDYIAINTGNSSYNIKAESTALSALGITVSASDQEKKDGIKISKLNEKAAEQKAFSSSYVKTADDALNYLTGRELSVTYGGETKTVKFISEDQMKTLDETALNSQEAKLEALKNALQTNINHAFGAGKVSVAAGSDGALSFKAADDATSLSINVSNAEVRKNLGLSENASNKMTMGSSLLKNRESLGLTNQILGVADNATEEQVKNALNEKLADFTINGKKIEGLTADTSVNDLINKINNTKDAGVRATYMNGTNQFVLVATNTGTGREISLDDEVSKAIFNGESKDGTDAILAYDYGNGATQTVRSSTNTFNIDGMSIKVSGTFGYITETNADGTTTSRLENTTGVTFKAEANVDKATEKVKKFIEDFNEIVKAVNDQKRTRPDSSYKPLTDAQKDEMTEKQIEEWEKKAQQGILYSEDVIRDFSSALGGVSTALMTQGYRYSDLEKIGLTFSDDYTDGGKLVFDEDKFKQAMKDDPSLVSSIIAGDGTKKGLAKTIEDTFTPYATRFATRNGNSYGRLVEAAGSSKLPLSAQNNTIYKSLQEMNKKIDSLKELLKTEQERYKNQFTSMESTISDLNNQSAYIMGITG